ncbi:MAG TPA: serine hydrolase [Bacteroidales bacterium]|nr:serine hydrolase [Bacteroidales bacterium]
MKKLFALFVSVWLAVPYVTPALSQDQPSASSLTQSIEQACQTLDPAGLAVAVVKDGKTEILYTYGKESMATGQQVTAGSLFNIASCSKAFTAASLAVLVQEGKLQWDDLVTQYIPELKLADPYITSNLNLIDILAHRSGFSTFTGDLLWYRTDYTNEQIIERMRYLPIENEFRSEYGYQNNMYMVAGEIIERVTGKSWSAFVKERFFDPLGMKATAASSDELPANADIAYPHDQGEQMEIYDFQGTKPAASIYSNIRDLSRWVQMWLAEGRYGDHTIMNPGAVSACLTPRTLLGVSRAREKQGTHFRAYGLGWSMYDYNGVKVVEHSGGMPGYLSKITMVPEHDLGIVILNNGFDLFIRQVVLNTVMDAYLELEAEKDYAEEAVKVRERYLKSQKKEREKRLGHRIENTNPSLKPQDYQGSYVDKFYGKAEIRMTDEGPELSLLPAAEFFTSTMKHWHYDTYRVDFKDPFLPFGLVTFDFNSKGEVRGFSIDLPSNDFHFQNLYFEKIPGTAD